MFLLLRSVRYFPRRFLRSPPSDQQQLIAVEVLEELPLLAMME